MVRSDVVLLGCLLSFVGAAQAPPVVLTSNATFGPSDPALEGMDVVVQGCTVAFDGPHNFQSLTVQGAGVVTHSANFSYLGVFGMHLTVAGDVVVHAGSSINADQQGYPGGAGPGAGVTGNNNAVSGGAHGGGGGWGLGGNSQTATGGEPYGDYAAPTLPGSGGGAYGALGWGGGVVRLSVGGTLTLDGIVTANGQSAASAGAGGSVRIDCATFAGSGVVRANGGANPSYGGGGGGGRVAIYAASSTFVGAVTALQGAGTPASDGRGGGVGTVFLGYASPGGTLIYDGGGVPADLRSPIAGGIDLGGLEVRGGAGASLGVAGADVAGDVLVDGAGTRLGVDGPLTAGGDVGVLNGAFVDHSSGVWTGSIAALGAMTIDSTSFLTADARGHLPGMGPGAGVTGNNNAAGGGAHGGGGGWGLGGNGQTAAGGDPYGDYAAPTLPGSGGGAFGASGWGGGVIRLSVGGTLTLDGIVTSNGQSAGSAGAGGSVWIDCASFAGNGVVRANGGANPSSGGGGGGGRVAIYAASSAFVGTVSALPGAGTPASAGRGGGVGTVFLGYASPGGTLAYDCGGSAADIATTTPAGAAVGALIVSGGARVRVGPSGIRLLHSVQVEDSGSVLTVDGTVHAGGAAAITGGALVTHSQATEGARFVIGEDFLLDAASAIDLNGKGQVSMFAPGAGHPFCGQLYIPCISTPLMPTGYGGGGGANGGAGGISLLFCCCATTPSNVALNPAATTATLGGAGGTGSATGHAGGGAMRLDVGGVCTLLGSVTANGVSTPLIGDDGGGAGGSIFISAPAYGAAATVFAVGGSSHGLGGGGGGGAVRIAGPPALSAVVAGGAPVNVPCGAFGASNAPAMHGVAGVAAIGAAFEYYVLTQPASVTVCEGGTATFLSGGNGPCRWRRDGVPLVDGGGVSGAASPTLVVSGATPAHAGVYDCVVGDVVYATPAVSSGATLTVHTAPTIAVSPGSGVFFNEAPLTLTAAATGSPAPTLQWTKNGAAIPGATGPTLAIASLAFADAGTYACVAANLCGSATSAAVAVTVENPVPTLASLSPSSIVAGSGTTTVTLTGSGFVATSLVRRFAVGHFPGFSLLPTTFVNSTTLQATLSAALSADGHLSDLQVINPGPGGGASVGKTMIVANPDPQLDSISPATVLAGSGPATLTLTGANFVPSSVVQSAGFGGTFDPPYASTFVDSTTIVVTLTDAMVTGHRDRTMRVFNPAPGGGGSVYRAMWILGPRLFAVAPSALPAPPPLGGPPVPLSLVGENFEPGCVAYANQVALTTTFVDAQHLNVLLPPIDATQFPGALTLTVVNFGDETSNRLPLLTTPGVYVGSVGQNPPAPSPGGVVAVKLEGFVPGTPFLLVMDVAAPAPFGLAIPHSGGLNGVLVADPSTVIPLLDGLGIFLPPNPAAVFVHNGFAATTPTGEFTLAGIPLPAPALGIEVTIQAIVPDPAALFGVAVSIPAYRFDI